MADETNTGGPQNVTPNPGAIQQSNPAPKVDKEIVKPEKVEVDVKMLEEILAEVKKLRDLPEVVEKLQKENKMLTDVADVGRLSLWQARNNPQGLVRTARAWEWGGVLVKATLTLRNQVFTDVNGRVSTDQVLKVILEDGKELEVSYDQFNKEKTLREGEIIGRNETPKGMFYTIKFKDGKEFEVNYVFLN